MLWKILGLLKEKVAPLHSGDGALYGHAYYSGPANSFLGLYIYPLG